MIHDRSPRIRATGEDADLARDEAARSARMPSVALRAARDALSRGPVLVQVPRRGYLVAVACEACRARAHCAACGGPLAVEGSGAPPRCRWCGRPQPGWQCPACGSGRLRALVAGSRRTAEELGRAFPGVRVLTSGGASVLAAVPAQPALVVATPGAEPLAEGGYAAAVLLDGWALLGRPSLAAATEALRRWLNAAALVVPAPSGGTVTIVAEAGLPTVQALIRWDPVTHAERELAERSELRFPPSVRMAAVTGPAGLVTRLLADTELPPGADVLGPVELPGQAGPAAGAGGTAPAAAGARHDGAQPEPRVRVLIRVGRPRSAALAAALAAAQAARSARKDGGQIRVQLDPAELV